MSDIMHFTTAIPAGDRTPYKAIFYGDMGVDPYPEAITTAKLVHEEVLNNEIRFIYHNGDISYARGYVGVSFCILYFLEKIIYYKLVNL